MTNIQHADIPEANLHEPKGASTALAGQVYEADGAGSGVWINETATNEIIVSVLGDLPTPVSGVITLVATTVYRLNGHIDIGANRIVLSLNSTLRGYGAPFSSITSTTTGALFTATTSFHLDAFTVTATSGTVFACTGGSFESAYIREFTINSCTTVGTFTAWYSLFWESGAVVSSTSPLTMAGTCNILILDLVSWITGYTTAVDLGVATFNTCTFNRCGFGYASATTHIDIAPSSANINSTNEGRITQCSFNASATNIAIGYTTGDINWDVRHCLHLENSTRSAQAYMHTTTVTTITGGTGDTGNPTLVNGGTSWLSGQANQFTITTAGRVTYVGNTQADFTVSCGIGGTVSAGTQTVNHYLAKNGTVITASKTQKEYASTAVGSPTPCSTLVELSNGDYIELYVENITGTNNWSSALLNLVIGEVI